MLRQILIEMEKIFWLALKTKHVVLQINAKITDYGISQFTTLSPLTANQGTPSYRAPEVIRGETYSFQVFHQP